MSEAVGDLCLSSDEKEMSRMAKGMHQLGVWDSLSKV